ncbi:MAG: hypothetical protein DIU78_019420 [Pseudomonadota bacterium]|nr:MAG: hypothetical protein DIU78_07340 [Pseudomonadota bacterium]
MSRLAQFFRPRALLVGLAVASGAAVCVAVPGPPERSLPGLARLLGDAVNGVVEPDDIAWEPSAGFLSDLVLGRRVLFLAAPEPGSPRDVYRARVRLTSDGSPVQVRQLRNLTDTPRGDDVALEVVGHRAVFATIAFDRIQGISILDTRGVPESDRPEGWLDRFLLRLSSYQETGSFAGIGRTDIVLDAPARLARFSLRNDRLSIDFGERGRSLSYDVEERVLHGEDGAEAYAARALPRVHRGKPLVFWLVDSARAVLGPTPVAWLERVAFGARDGFRRTTYSLFGTHGADDALRGDAEPPRARVLDAAAVGTTRSTWPPPPIPSLWKQARPGEGQWEPVTYDFLKPVPNTLTDGGAPAPYFYRTFIRPDPERPYSEVLLIAMDMRQLELGMQAGYEDPKPTTGPPGEGRLPRDPAIYERVVATFNGAFKTTHGEYGMMVNRRVLLPPVPGGASIVVDDLGRVGLGSWPQTEEIPPEIVSFRQNLDPLVEDGIANPTGRNLWGWHLEGKSVMTERTALCVTPAGHLYYAWGAEIDGETLGRALHQAGCSYGVHLDMNPGHCGFVFSNIKNPGTGDMVLRLADDRMKIGPDRYARWSAKDFFYVMVRDPIPRDGPVTWAPASGVQPPPSWLPGIFTAQLPIGGLVVDLLRVEAGRVDVRVRAGANEPKAPGGAPPSPLTGPDAERALAAIGLGHATASSQLGIADGPTARVPLLAGNATLVLEDGRAPRVALPGELPKLSPKQLAVQLPMLAREGKPLVRASARGTSRLRAALCVRPSGSLVIAQIVHDSSAPLAAALLALGCRDVLELDRGSAKPAFVHRAGTTTPPMSSYDASALYLLARPMIPYAHRWKPAGSTPSTRVTSYDLPGRNAID